MKIANLSDVKDQLSAYVEIARSGEPVRILVRGVPAAGLVRAEPEPEERAWLVELERKGKVRRGTLPFDVRLLSPGPVVAGSPSQDLVAERRGR